MLGFEDKREAVQRVVDLGGLYREYPNTVTDYLIINSEKDLETDCKIMRDFKSMQEKGKEIKVITYDEFLGIAGKYE